MRTLTFHRVIGSGAMGTVYHAELEAPGGFTRSCAVKVMHDAGPERSPIVSRMRDEARLLGLLNDEQIIGVLELVEVEGRDAVIMEYVDGIGLNDLLSAHRLPARALAEFGAEIASTLHRAHAAVHPKTGRPLRVIHRDVKPANMMITARGGVRLLDFGIARAAFAKRESRTEGLVFGTLNYFAPEILVGAEPTSAVDIYGLGITLWECATGKPWGAPRVQKNRYERRVSGRLAAIQEDYALLTPILQRMLSWEPTDRPTGAMVERELLLASDASVGQGLRLWSRKVVPQLMAERKARSIEDPLVGRTCSVEEAHDVTSQPEPDPADRIPRDSSPRDRSGGASGPNRGAAPAEGSKTTPKKAARRSRWWIAAGCAVVLGALLCVCAVGSILAVVVVYVPVF